MIKAIPGQSFEEWLENQQQIANTEKFDSTSHHWATSAAESEENICIEVLQSFKQSEHSDKFLNGLINKRKEEEQTKNAAISDYEGFMANTRMNTYTEIIKQYSSEHLNSSE